MSTVQSEQGIRRANAKNFKALLEQEIELLNRDKAVLISTIARLQEESDLRKTEAEIASRRLNMIAQATMAKLDAKDGDFVVIRSGAIQEPDIVAFADAFRRYNNKKIGVILLRDDEQIAKLTAEEASKLFGPALPSIAK